tara:strand:- start:483 stop:590 length:108 start_codon:yes stop_codon:yes gene_type:complete
MVVTRDIDMNPEPVKTSANLDMAEPAELPESEEEI